MTNERQILNEIKRKIEEIDPTDNNESTEFKYPYDPDIAIGFACDQIRDIFSEFGEDLYDY